MPRRQMTRSRTDCATCKGRAVTCDRARPDCSNCSRTSRKCQWYGLKLSWPRVNDRRRAIVSKASSSRPTKSPISDARFIHTTNWDIELYHALTSSGLYRTLSLLDVPVIWNPFQLNASDRELLEYFCGVASASLATFGHNATALGRIIARIALDGNTSSTTAALKAVLAFASLHRDGLHVQSIERKITALRHLAEGPVAPILCAKETIRHVVTGMLLCSFEVHQSSCTSGQWTGYLAGVQTVLRASSIKTLLEVNPDVAVLLDWVYYHNTVGRFSLLHWKKQTAPELPLNSTDLFSLQLSTMPSLNYTLLDLLSQVCNAVFDTTISPSNSDNYKSFLQILEWRIRALPIPKFIGGDDAARDDPTSIMHLYQLAILVYLHRSFESLFSQHNRTQKHIEEAFKTFSRLRSCKEQFPIFIIGCEARQDEQRALILDIISESEQMSSSRYYGHCRGLLQAFWAQDDLACGNNISYSDRMTSVMSVCKIVPTFV